MINPSDNLFQIRITSYNVCYTKLLRLDYYLGIQANRYVIKPGKLDPGSGNSILPVKLDDETSYELSVV